MRKAVPLFSSSTVLQLSCLAAKAADQVKHDDKVGYDTTPNFPSSNPQILDLASKEGYFWY